MALTKASLSGKIETNMIAVMGTPADAGLLKKFCDAIAEAVVDEIQENAVVNTAGTVLSGAGAGGTTSATGTIE